MSDMLTRSLGDKSDESTLDQLKLARDQGKSFGRAVRTMTTKEAHGEEAEAGDMLVGWAVEHAEGMYHWENGELHWQNPAQSENAHVEIVVRDRHDGRFIPGLNVTVTLLDQGGKEIGTHEQPFLWHPWLYHYGRNWSVPGDGTYKLAVQIEPPTFMRHDKENGNRYAHPVEVEFENVRIQTGQKIS